MGCVSAKDKLKIQRGDLEDNKNKQQNNHNAKNPTFKSVTYTSIEEDLQPNPINKTSASNAIAS